MTAQNVTPEQQPMRLRYFQFWILALLAIFGIVWLISDVLTPFVMGIAIAYLFHPAVTYLTTKGVSRTTATLLLLGVFFLILGGLLTAVVPMLADQVAAFVAKLPEYRVTLLERLEPLFRRIYPNFQNNLGIGKLRETMSEHSSEMASIATSVLSGVWQSGQAIMGLIGLIVIMPVVAFYLLRDWPFVLNKVDEALPRNYHKVIVTQMKKVDEVLGAFLRGQIMVCIILGTIYAVGLAMVGLDFGFTLGFVTGLFTFIPYVGNFIGLAGATALALAQFGLSQEILYVFAVFGVGQFLESNLITPKLVGESVGLHPLWIIFAIMVGGTLLGFVGMLLAVPTAAAAGVWLRYAYGRYTESTYYKARDPKPKAKA